MRNGLDIIQQEHDTIRNVFQHYKNTSERDAKLAVVQQMVALISQHTSAEERILYPLMLKEEVCKPVIERTLVDDAINKELLEWLDGRRPDSELEWQLYDKTVHKLMNVELEALELQEADILYYLKQVLSPQELEQLAADWEDAKANAPRHPHPHQTSQPLAAKVMHPVLHAADKAAGALKDAIANDSHTDRSNGGANDQNP